MQSAALGHFEDEPTTAKVSMHDAAWSLSLQRRQPVQSHCEQQQHADASVHCKEGRIDFGKIFGTNQAVLVP